MPTSILSVFGAPGDAVLPLALLLLKATLLLGAAWLATRLMPRASAGTRHLVWLVSLGTLFVLPAFAMWSPWRLEILPSQLGSVSVASGVADAAPRHSALPDAQPASPNDQAPRSATAPAGATSPREGGAAPPNAPVPPSVAARTAVTPSVGVMLLIVWGTVGAVIAGVLALGLLSVRRIVRRAEPLTTPDWQVPLYEIADRLGLDDAPRLLRSEQVTMPFACGLLRPTIVLPDSASAWSAERRSAVLLHELGHIRRRDLVGHTLGRVACALYWFHPLVWTAAKRLRAESERACDDLALVCGARASDYAEHLLDIVTRVRHHSTPSVALAMAHRREFEGRMLAILDPEVGRKGPSRAQSIALAGALGVMALVVGAAAPARAASEGTPSLMASRDRGDDRAADGVDSIAPPSAAMSVLADSSERMTMNTRTATDTREVRERQTIDSGHDVPRPAPLPNARPEPAAKPNVVVGSGANEDDAPSAPTASAVDASAARALRWLAERSRVAGAAQSEGQSSDDRPILLARVLRTDTSAALRRIAAWGLNDYAGTDVALEALIGALERDADAGVREMAAWALADADQDARAADALVRAIRQERDAKVRATALWALADLSAPGHQASIDVFAAMLDDTDVRGREMAAWGIGQIEPRRAPAQLLAALGDGDATVRLAVAWALFQIEDPDAVDAIDKALGRESDANVKRALIRALAATGEQSVEAIKRLIDSNDPETRSVAIRALAGQGHSPWPWPRPRPRPNP